MRVETNDAKLVEPAQQVDRRGFRRLLLGSAIALVHRVTPLQYIANLVR
jgi:hypothetical protein